MKRTIIRLHVLVQPDPRSTVTSTVYSEDVLPEHVPATVERLKKAYPHAVKIKQQQVLPGNY